MEPGWLLVEVWGAEPPRLDVPRSGFSELVIPRDSRYRVTSLGGEVREVMRGETSVVGPALIPTPARRVVGLHYTKGTDAPPEHVPLGACD
jgi:hypothetical protein